MRILKRKFALWLAAVVLVQSLRADPPPPPAEIVVPPSTNAAQPEAKGVDRNNLTPGTNLVKGLDTNYAWMGEHWPDSRYIVIGLGSGESGTTPIGPWHCVYDTETGAFSIPPDIAAFNKSKMPWK